LRSKRESIAFKAAAPASPTLLPDDGAASAATQATQSQPTPMPQNKQQSQHPKTTKIKTIQSLQTISKSKISHERLTEVIMGLFNVCRLLFFSNAAANAAAPASPTLFPDDGAASAATQATQSQPTPMPQNKQQSQHPKTTKIKIIQSLQTISKIKKLTVKIQRLQAAVPLQRSSKRSSSSIAHGVI
jgi:hypothetical protein